MAIVASTVFGMLVANITTVASLTLTFRSFTMLHTGVASLGTTVATTTMEAFTTSRATVACMLSVLSFILFAFFAFFCRALCVSFFLPQQVFLDDNDIVPDISVMYTWLGTFLPI